MQLVYYLGVKGRSSRKALQTTTSCRGHRIQNHWYATRNQKQPHTGVALLNHKKDEIEHCPRKTNCSVNDTTLLSQEREEQRTLCRLLSIDWICSCSPWPMSIWWRERSLQAMLHTLLQTHPARTDARGDAFFWSSHVTVCTTGSYSTLDASITQHLRLK